MNRLLQDLRFALRHFRRTPIITITMVLVLAIGIGVNSALFDVLSSILSRPPAGISQDKALVRIRTLQKFSREQPSLWQRDASYPEFQDYAAHTELFSTVIASFTSDAVLDRVDDNSGPAAITVEYVSPGYFAALGVRPTIGAGLPPVAPDDPSALEPVAVISAALWSQRFGSAADVVGKTFRLSGVSLTVVGVAPWPFQGLGGGTAVWVPLSLRAAILRGGFGILSSRDSLLLTLFARLRPRVTAEHATTIVQTIARRSIETMSPKIRPFLGTADVVPIRVDNRYPEEESFAREIGTGVAVVTLLVLLITCLNVSALLTGSAVGRSGEIAIRLSLGAPRSRIVRQLLTENAVVAVSGGALGLFLLWFLTAVVQVRTSTGVDLVVGWDTTLFTLAFSVGTALLFGISPALHATRVSVSETMKRAGAQSGTTRSRLQRTFVVAQIALTQPLLLGLAIPLSDVIHRMGGDAEPGVRDHIITAEVVWSNGRPRDTTSAATLGLEQRFRAVPGVVSVVRMPLDYAIDRLSVHPADRRAGTADTKMNARIDGVGVGYFALMGIPMLRGRDFSAGDEHDETVVIIGNDLARTLWGNADPIGKRLQSWRWGEDVIEGSLAIDTDIEAPMPSDSEKPRTLTVVGVVNAALAGKSDDPHQIRVFTPSSAAGTMLIRTGGPGIATVPVLRAIASREFPELPLSDLQTLAQRDAAEHKQMLMGSAVAAGAGALILLLASIGVYGVVAFAVAQRTREIGVRMALGASPGTVVAMFLRSGAVLGGFGLAIGLPLSLAAMRILTHTIGFPRFDTVTVTAEVALVVVVVSLLATWLPARRAARVDPLVALRAE